MRSVELFAGAGGLALGMARAGFEHLAVIERDHNACETFRENQLLSNRDVERWRLLECDVRDVDYSALKSVDVVSGGPPCQPFSLGGKHRAHLDHRDMFPEAVRAVRQLRPKAFIFENVKGILRESFAAYFEYIYLQLTYPSVWRLDDEDWADHRARLERHHSANRDGAEYNVAFRLLNSADYGVPQRRERVFLVGFRSDIGAQWSFPEPTHSEASLLRSQWLTNEYWERHQVSARGRGCSPSRLPAKVARLRGFELFEPPKAPWLTVRDAIQGLPDPQTAAALRVANHRFNPGARSYPGHTGSPLDEPAKTLKAGDHGVPGGENMLVHPDGSVRYFTVREAARLQTFPDAYVFRGSWTEAMRQLGNAVPVRLAEIVSRSVATVLSDGPSQPAGRDDQPGRSRHGEECRPEETEEVSPPL